MKIQEIKMTTTKQKIEAFDKRCNKEFWTRLSKPMEKKK